MWGITTRSMQPQMKYWNRYANARGNLTGLGLYRGNVFKAAMRYTSKG